jgi:hypothetical protein
MINIIKKKVNRMIKYLYCRNKLIFFQHNPKSNMDISTETCSNKVQIISRINKLNELVTVQDALYSRAAQEVLKGSTIYLFSENMEIVHFSCISTEKIYTAEIKAYVRPKENGIYIYNCLTSPNHRGKGLYTRAVSQIINDNQGVNCYMTCLDSNHASLSVINKLGFDYIGSVIENSTFFIRSCKLEKSVEGFVC